MGVDGASESPPRLGRRAALGLGLGVLAGCGRRSGGRPGRLVFKHQPMWGDPAPFRRLLDAFRRAHPEIELVTEALPNSSDATHQFYLTALEGGADDFDVFVVDIIWVAELARAGWILDLSGSFPPDDVRRDFLEGAAETALQEGRTFGVPWYVDVGILYRRTDWVPDAPTTLDELVEAAGAAARREGAAGLVWQGRQYEGLVCNAYEAIWAHGGETLRDGRLVLDSPETLAAVSYLRGLITSGISPRSVLSMAEEESRRVFQSGGAAFMRNWPYALVEAEREDSPIRGRVAVSTLPTASGRRGAGALGGFDLALNANAPRENRDAALALVRHLTSSEASLVLATAYGRNPARRAAYEDPALLGSAPCVAALRPLLEGAKPRPITPFYPMLTDVLQSELSAIVAGIRSPSLALSRAQAAADRIMGSR